VASAVSALEKGKKPKVTEARPALLSHPPPTETATVTSSSPGLEKVNKAKGV
jgi:hypothetical protein